MARRWTFADSGRPMYLDFGVSKIHARAAGNFLRALGCGFAASRWLPLADGLMGTPPVTRHWECRRKGLLYWECNAF